MAERFERYLKSGLQHENHKIIGAEPPETDFQRELRELLNRHSKENGSGTPDFILADYLERQLQVFNMTVQRRANWRGESIDIPAASKDVEDPDGAS